MPYGWEGNRRPDVALQPCVTDFSGLSTYGLNDLMKEDEHLARRLHSSKAYGRHPLPVYLYQFH